MRRVVILVENLPVPLDRRVWQEASALRDAGWAVTVIGPRGRQTMRRQRERIDGIDVLRYPQRAATGLRGYLAEYIPSMLFSLVLLLRVRAQGRVDVIHGCNPPDLFWLLGWLGRAWGARYVFDQHDANPELSRTKFGEPSLVGRLLHALTTWLERLSYATAALVIVPNDSYAELAERRGGVPASRLVVVRNAPDVRRYRKLASAVRPTRHSVGYVGVMGSQDGLDLLVDAWARVVQAPNLADSRLELVGDGEAREALERQVASLGLADSVRFHGYLRPDAFVPILAACMLCVSPDPPTPFNDVSTMVKVVDYMAIGRPVVTFDLHETRLVAGEGARIVRPPNASALASALIELLTDDAELARLGRAASTRPEALELDWSVSAGRLVTAYEDLVADVAPAAGS